MQQEGLRLLQLQLQLMLEYYLETNIFVATLVIQLLSLQQSLAVLGQLVMHQSQQ